MKISMSATAAVAAPADKVAAAVEAIKVATAGIPALKKLLSFNPSVSNEGADVRYTDPADRDAAILDVWQMSGGFRAEFSDSTYTGIELAVVGATPAKLATAFLGKLRIKVAEENRVATKALSDAQRALAALKTFQ